MDLHLKCNSSIPHYAMGYPQNSRDVETEVLRLKSEISSLKFDLRGHQSRSLKSREIWQAILDKHDQINELKWL